MSGIDSKNTINSDNLAAYKEQAMKEFKAQNNALKEKAKNVHNQYVKPHLERAYTHASKRPLAALFMAAFFTLSFFPILSFLVFSGITVLIILGTALFWSTVIVGGAAIALVATLSFTGFLAVGLGFWSLVGYETWRFTSCLIHSRNLAEGLQEFEAEARSLFLGQVPTQSENNFAQAGSILQETTGTSTNGFKAE